MKISILTSTYMEYQSRAESQVRHVGVRRESTFPSGFVSGRYANIGLGMGAFIPQAFLIARNSEYTFVSNSIFE